MTLTVTQQDQLKTIKNTLDDLGTKLENIRDELSNKFEALSSIDQEGDSGENLQGHMDLLDNAEANINAAVDDLEELFNTES